MKKKRRSKIKLKNIDIIVNMLIVFNLFFIPLALAEDTDKNADNLEPPTSVQLKVTLTPPYIIGPGDQVTITDRTLKELFGQVEKYDLIVSADGSISIPLPDGTQQNLLVAGYTLEDLSKEVRTLFGKTLKNPLVFIQLSGYRPINIYIGGEIVNPGVYKVETSTTQAEDGKTTASTSNTFELSLSQAIQLAGGLKPRANIRSIVVTGGSNSEKRIVDFKALITGDDAFQDVNLQPGDTIFVPIADKVEDQAQSNVVLLGRLAYQEVAININGEVKEPGNFTLPNDATIFDALGKAGGTNVVGTLKKVKIARFDENGIYRWREYNLNDLLTSGATLDQISLRPNDKIEIQSSKGKEIRHYLNNISQSLVYVIGNNVGTFLLQDHMFRRISHQKKGLNNANSLFDAGGGSSVTVIQSK